MNDGSDLGIIVLMGLSAVVSIFIFIFYDDKEEKIHFKRRKKK